jgi:hypothetical protein
MALPEIFSDPLPYAALIVTLVAVVAWQASIGFGTAHRINRFKRAVFPLADRFRRPLVRRVRRHSPTLATVLNGTIPHLIHDKGRHDDPEYLETWACRPGEAFTRLSKAGFSANVASSLKRRPAPVEGSVQYSALSMAYYHDDGTQTEVYAFDNPDGTIDVYAHHETSVTDPEGHLSDPQADGDPRGVVPSAPSEAQRR